MSSVVHHQAASRETSWVEKISAKGAEQWLGRWWCENSAERHRVKVRDEVHLILQNVSDYIY